MPMTSREIAKPGPARIAMVYGSSPRLPINFFTRQGVHYWQLDGSDGSGDEALSDAPS